ncbi:MAG: hypothetical protein ACXWLR_15830 [Myxococcales bacterium]
MFDLYEKLFAPFPTESATYMWWDLIAAHVLEPIGRDEVVPQPFPNQERVRREMVEALIRIHHATAGKRPSMASTTPRRGREEASDRDVPSAA